MDFEGEQPVWLSYNRAGSLMVELKPEKKRLAKIFLHQKKFYLKPFDPIVRLNGKKIEKKYASLQSGDQISIELTKLEFRLEPSSSEKKQKKEKKKTSSTLVSKQDEKVPSQKSKKNKKTEEVSPKKKSKKSLKKSTPSPVEEAIPVLEEVPLYENPIASSEATLTLPDLDFFEEPSARTVSPVLDIPITKGQKTAKLKRIEPAIPISRPKKKKLKKTSKEDVRNSEKNQTPEHHETFVVPAVSMEKEPSPVVPPPLAPSAKEVPSEKTPFFAKKIIKTTTVRKVKAIPPVLEEKLTEKKLAEEKPNEEKPIPLVVAPAVLLKEEKKQPVTKSVPNVPKETTKKMAPTSLLNQKEKPALDIDLSASAEENTARFEARLIDEQLAKIEKEKARKKEKALSDTEQGEDEVEISLELSDSFIASDIQPTSFEKTSAPTLDMDSRNAKSSAKPNTKSATFENQLEEEVDSFLTEEDEIFENLNDHPAAGSAEDILASSVLDGLEELTKEGEENPLSQSKEGQMNGKGLKLKKFHSDESIKGNLFSAAPGEATIRKEIIKFSELLSPSNLITTKNFKKDILLGRVLAERKMVSLTIINKFLLEIYRNKSNVPRTLGQLLVISRQLKGTDYAQIHRDVEELFLDTHYLERLSDEYVIEWLGGAVRILIQLQNKFGSYPIIAELGSGGMGHVYKAVDVKGKKIIALKVLRNLTSEVHIKRFQKEIRTTLKLTHPNIVPVYDVGEYDGVPYYTMKLIEGKLLNKYITENPLPAIEAMKLGLKICRAVGYAHKHQVLHRDLKPQNILVDADGEPYLTDFGVAKELDSDSVLTKSDETLGTPRYMSPEQIKGGRSVDARSDVYSLGIILYELINGKSPIKGETSVNIIYEILHTAVPPLRTIIPELPEQIDFIIQKAILKEKKDRYPTAQELADDIERYLQHLPIEAKAPARSRLSKLIFLFLFLLILSMGTYSILYVFFPHWLPF